MRRPAASTTRPPSTPSAPCWPSVRPLAPQIVATLNPEIELADLDQDILEIGYPGRGRHAAQAP
ncbi:hypothetical protein [Streptomyces roseifaciens]|uniref:hypothetical protein n=1 Tax=Streptomyces roseifaciens TaxID=1488406 RepID=UPI0011877304|nr:hypothetical protein [Streptomyces roseifaciens]